MKINYECLPCIVNQVIKIGKITNADNQEELFKKVFNYLSTITFNETNPEIVGNTFDLIKKHINNEDPYLETRNYYNDFFLNKLNSFEEKINNANDSFYETIKYAIIGNVIDFNPIHSNSEEDILKWFNNIDNLELTINDIKLLKNDIINSKKMLYIGDNCGEICLDKLLIKQIKKLNPDIEIYFGVRGSPVVNDSIEIDAYNVGINEYAKIISNGNNSLGTVLHHCSKEFKEIYNNSDIIISKGQANYESLSEENKNIYFLLVAKCAVIAKDIGVDIHSIICKKLLK